MFAVFHHDWVTMLILLLFAHCYFDYPGQGDYLAKAKDPNGDLGKDGVWVHALLSHAMIHAGAVFVITGSKFCMVLELIAHAWTDFGKCNKWITYDTDQLIHMGCKVLFVLIIFL